MESPTYMVPTQPARVNDLAKCIGPPPAYRSSNGTVTEADTWSDYSGSSGLGKRRTSWVNLVESEENLNKFKVNWYPKVKQKISASQQVPSQPPSQASLGIAYITNNYLANVKSNCPALPLKAAPGPAGTLPPSSATQSRSPSDAVTPSAVVVTPHSGKRLKKRRNRLQDWKDRCMRPVYAMCLILVLMAVGGVIAAVVYLVSLKSPEEAQMSWLAPDSLRNGENTPVRIEMKAEKDQVRLQMYGAMPFKGNYISYYDFKTNRVAVIDETLRTTSRTCFVMPLDRSTLRDADTMRRAAGAASHRLSQARGWAEIWQYLPAPLFMNGRHSFDPPIPECVGARWIQIDYVGYNQKNRKCSDCYDFCLPDYGVEKDGVRGEEQLNIARRVCFYLFVPEWRTYAQANSIEQNQRDFETYYRNRNHLSTSYGSKNVMDTKWIKLQQFPQAVQNVTGNLVGQLGNAANRMVNAVGQVAHHVSAGVFGHSDHGPNYQNGNDFNAPMEPNANQNGFGPAANGVVNLNGAMKGRNGDSLYNSNANGDSQRRYVDPNIYPNGNGISYPRSTERSNLPITQEIPAVAEYYKNRAQQLYIERDPRYMSRLDERDPNFVPYTNDNGFAAQGSNFQPSYPDANGVNPPTGYVPQAAVGVQGVAGMQTPSNPITSNSGGYRPDIMPNPQYQQQQHMHQLDQQRWIQG